jgi:hypothetical protein
MGLASAAPFAREADMAGAVTRWLQGRRHVVRSEFVSPWGICDLVGVCFDRARVRHRLMYGQRSRVASITRAALLLRVPDAESGCSTNIERMIHLCTPAITADVVAREVQHLADDGFIKRGPGDRLQKLNGWVPLQKSLVAVEMKLSRVDDAMHQARRNLGFADHSYVAFPTDVAKRIATPGSRWSAFFAEGVGLLGVSRSRCRVLVPARRATASLDSALQLYCVDKFWVGYLKGS